MTLAALRFVVDQDRKAGFRRKRRSLGGADSDPLLHRELPRQSKGVAEQRLAIQRLKQFIGGTEAAGRPRSQHHQRQGHFAASGNSSARWVRAYSLQSASQRR